MGFNFKRVKKLIAGVIILCLPALVLAETVTTMAGFEVKYIEKERVYSYTGQILLKATNKPARNCFVYLVDVVTGETKDVCRADQEGFFDLRAEEKIYQVLSSSKSLSPKKIKAMLKGYREKEEKKEI